MRVVRWTLVAWVIGASACGDGKLVPGVVDPNDRSVHAVSVSPDHAVVIVDGQLQLGASIDAGAGVGDRSVTWTSTNMAVASVSSTGLVIGHSVGSITIIATAKADSSKHGTSAVQVAVVPQRLRAR